MLTFPKQSSRAGFALPTILISSVVLFIILVSATVASANIRTGLKDQYYNQLAREASEAGVARAQECLSNNNYVPQWTTASPLRPSTGCSGATTCTASPACYVLVSGNVRTTFTVGLPDTDAASQNVKVVGRVELARSSGGSTWKSYEQTTVAKVGADVSFSNVVFGYHQALEGSPGGAFFATVTADGSLKTVGNNFFGQLGNGTTTDSATPQNFILPTNFRTARVFANFLSVGLNMFALSDDGRVYAAGANNYGQLGVGNFTAKVSTPAQVVLPAGEKAAFVGALGWTNFVIAESGNVYSMGACDWGILGSNYTISGCANRSSPVRVALPTPNSSDMNTMPVVNDSSVPQSNMVLDSYTAYLRMQGGRLYAWGTNNYGQFGNSSTTDSSVPVKVGTYGDLGSPRAVQMGYDGGSVWILDNTGTVKAAGFADTGSLAAPMQLRLEANNRCLDGMGVGAAGNVPTAWDCHNDTTLQSNKVQLWGFYPDGTIRNAQQNLCLDAWNGGGNGGSVNIYTCNGGLNQKWKYNDDYTITSQNGGGCLDAESTQIGGNGAPVQTWGCYGGSNQKWYLVHSHDLRNVAWSTPKTVTKLGFDERSSFFLTADGEVWGAGDNTSGQLGNGTAPNRINPALSKFILPAGVKAVDVYTTTSRPEYGPYRNTYVIGDDGNVYGAGSNGFGQLGIGTTATYVSTPVQMQLPAGVKARQVVTGYGTTIVITTNNKVYTVGNNSNGQLGDGTTTNSAIPKANRYTNVLPVTPF